MNLTRYLLVFHRGQRRRTQKTLSAAQSHQLEHLARRTGCTIEALVLRALAEGLELHLAQRAGGAA